MTGLTIFDFRLPASCSVRRTNTIHGLPFSGVRHPIYRQLTGFLGQGVILGHDHFFLLHYSLIILTFEAMYSELQTP
jgi:protein-S-isoprenylcysteine O-methyltransferase Ste14